jgi:hypothetical protein
MASPAYTMTRSARVERVQPLSTKLSTTSGKPYGVGVRACSSLEHAQRGKVVRWRPWSARPSADRRSATLSVFNAHVYKSTNFEHAQGHKLLSRPFRPFSKARTT